MSRALVPKAAKNDGKSNQNKKQQVAPAKKAVANTKVDALSTLQVKESGKGVLSFNLNDAANHTGKNFTSEEDKQYTVFVKELNAEQVVVSVKGPGVFESKPISRSPMGSPAGAALPSPQTLLGFEFSLSGAVAVKKQNGMP